MGAQTDEVIFSSAIPKVMYNDDEVEIHPDAYRLLYTENLFEVRKHSHHRMTIKPESRKSGVPPEAQAQRNITNMIMTRISGRYRKARRDYWQVKVHKLQKSQALKFSSQPEHNTLKQFFLLEFLVRGEKGMPPVIETVEDKKPGQQYIEMVKEEYKKKAQDYDERLPVFMWANAAAQRARQNRVYHPADKRHPSYVPWKSRKIETDGGNTSDSSDRSEIQKIDEVAHELNPDGTHKIKGDQSVTLPDMRVDDEGNGVMDIDIDWTSQNEDGDDEKSD